MTPAKSEPTTDDLMKTYDLKVVEYAGMVSGPMCGKLLADMGAEVVKIEPPGRGLRHRRLDGRKGAAR